MTKAANDHRFIGEEAPVSPGWVPVTQSPPSERDLLVWVNGPHIGRWYPLERRWLTRDGKVCLNPVRFWADIIDPCHCPAGCGGARDHLLD